MIKNRWAFGDALTSRIYGVDIEQPINGILTFSLDFEAYYPRGHWQRVVLHSGSEGLRQLSLWPRLVIWRSGLIPVKKLKHLEEFRAPWATTTKLERPL